MGSVQLLDKTRKIGKLLHNSNSSKVIFNDICKVIRDIVNSNVLVISKKGKVLGVGNYEVAVGSGGGDHTDSHFLRQLPDRRQGASLRNLPV